MCRTPLTLVAMGILLGLLTLASCGGGSSNPGTTSGVDLTGSLSLDSNTHGTSAVRGLAGATITAIDASNGRVQGTQVTGPTGSFEFQNLPNGMVMLRIEPGSAFVLSGIGSSDPLELIQQFDLAGAGHAQYNGLLTLVDSDGDGTADSLLTQRELRSDNGQQTQTDLREIRPAEQEVLIDSNDNGEVSDETPMEDVDSDGIPDNATGHMNSLHGGVLRGPIEAISADSITVEGVEFAITDATRWKDKGNASADHSIFVVGLNVLIHGMWNGDSWLALEVKTTGPRIEPPPGEENDLAISQFVAHLDSMAESSFSAGGLTFMFNGDTEWEAGGADATPADFAANDLLKVEAKLDGGSWVATEVRQLEADDSSGLLLAQFIGKIDEIGDAALTVGGFDFVLDDESEWYFVDGSDATAGDFATGDRVLVQAITDGTSWTAREIRPLQSDSGGLFLTQFIGHLEALAEPYFNLGAVQVHFTAGTNWENNGVETQTPDGFVDGDIVQAFVVPMEGGGWHAVEVRMLEQDTGTGLLMAQFFGGIDSLGDTAWTVGGMMFGVGLDTEFYSRIGVPAVQSFFSVGDAVLVEGSFSEPDWSADELKALDPATEGSEESGDEMGGGPPGWVHRGH